MVQISTSAFQNYFESVTKQVRNEQLTCNTYVTVSEPEKENLIYETDDY